MPIFPDDCQTVDDRTLSRILYQIANGEGKGRGRIDGVRPTLTWHTVCFSTGERPITESTKYGGAGARTIELFGSPFPGAEAPEINQLKQVIKENYGHAGRLFLEKLIALRAQPEEVEKLREKHTQYQRSFSDEAKSEVGDRHAHYFALVKVAADLVHEFLGIGDPVEAEAAIYEVFTKNIEQISEKSDPSVKAMEYVISWINGNEFYFKNENIKESFGIWREGKYVGILPHKILEIFQKNGFSDQATFRAIKRSTSASKLLSLSRM